jgi:hypothetical protein
LLEEDFFVFDMIIHLYVVINMVHI